jgi:hypothetical protein
MDHSNTESLLHTLRVAYQNAIRADMAGMAFQLKLLEIETGSKLDTLEYKLT